MRCSNDRRPPWRGPAHAGPDIIQIDQLLLIVGDVLTTAPAAWLQLCYDSATLVTSLVRPKHLIYQPLFSLFVNCWLVTLPGRGTAPFVPVIGRSTHTQYGSQACRVKFISQYVDHFVVKCQVALGVSENLIYRWKNTNQGGRKQQYRRLCQYQPHQQRLHLLGRLPVAANLDFLKILV